jgi:hypothetical protein
MKNQLKWGLAAAVMVGLGSPGAWAYTPSTDATITITPIVDVSLSVSPTTYAFGSLAVNTSSVTATSLVVTNDGNIDATIAKQIQSNSADWIADTSSTTANHFVLYVATSTTRPAMTDFTNTDHRFGAVANVTPLKGLGGSSPIVTAGGGSASPALALWFRLDMPMQVTTSAAQTITVRFTGTGQ